MAGSIDALYGKGLARAQRALSRLEDPLQLDRERRRFTDLPPPYTSDRSGTTTQPASPYPPSEEQRLRQEQRVQLGLEHDASKPYYQFEQQTSDEEKRIFEADLNGTRSLPVGTDPNTIAQEIVKTRWVEQGIWNNKWDTFASGRWKHEEPLELGSESDTDSQSNCSSPLFPLVPKQPQSKSRRRKGVDEKRRIAEHRVTREREREASRPYHQFVYQVSKERERIQDEYISGEGSSVNIPDINTTAYKNIKNTWTKRGIWNKRWGILPGMLWKHE